MDGKRKKALLSQNKVEDLLEFKLFCVTVWLYSAPNKREGRFLQIFSKILRNGWDRLKAFLFYNKVENLFMRDIVLFVIDFFAIFSSIQ